MNISGRRLFLIGFIVVLLVGIPVTVYLLQQQQQTQSNAQPSTNLTFTPTSTTAAPIQKNVGDSIPLSINVDPGKNLVSFVKLEIQYDPSILATASANAFTANTNAFPSVLEGPIYSPGKIAVTLSVGPDPTKAIQTAVTAGTVTFTALKNTPAGTPTIVTFTTNTQVLSIGPNDQASENVLSSATPATIAVGGSAAISPTQPIPSGATTPTVALTPTTAPSAALTPTDTPVPTTAPITQPTATPTPASSSGTTSTNVPPTCNSLTVDRGTTGTAPFSLTFTANGNDTDGTVSQVAFTFGDGQVSNVTQAGGIGTATVNVQDAHTYNNPGTYTATATLTDNSGGTSPANGNCQQTITVTAASGSAGTSVNPSPTMPPTGSTGLAVGIGLGATLLILGGGLLFFIL